MSMDNVKVYTVNGAPSGSSTSLPDWLIRKRAAKGKGKREIREHIEGTIDLVQHFEFPEASNRIRTTRDGHHAMATGTYKPQIHVYDLDQLSIKFERHTDAENVDFIILSDDWTKSLHLQNDRTVELHTQGGFHYRTRIPRFGRTLAYHFPTCDALVAGAGSEVYRLNLAQGRFMAPFVLDPDSAGEGINAIDINPAHQLFAFGIDGRGLVSFWDPRARSKLGTLELPPVDVGEAEGVTSLASRADGLSLAVGTAAGKTLLYDLRASRPFATKDQGYGLPVHCLSWIEGGSRMAGDGLVVSADKKVVKIWDRNSPGTNFASVTPAADINHLHHLPGSGMLMLANEGIQMTSYYIPQLGPAPRWCSFLDNITEEMEEQTVRNVYEDYKFVGRSELDRLGLTHLIGTPTLKPYMHGFFLSLKLYDAARLIANPFAYDEHRERLVRDKLEKLSESRIRSRGSGQDVKVNKALAERLRRLEKKREKKAAAAEGEDKVEVEGEGATSLLSDPRFAEVFANPEFEVDTESREYGLLNPANAPNAGSRGRTAVEDEEDESDRSSSDGLGSDLEDDEEMDVDSDSSREGDLVSYNPRARPGPKSQPAQSTSTSRPRPTQPQRKTNNGPRLTTSRTRPAPQPRDNKPRLGKDAHLNVLEDGGFEMSFVPSGRSDPDERRKGGKKPSPGGKKAERFGAGMERGGRVEDVKENIPGPVLLLTAHPDDECMFFSPTILALREQRKDIRGLCLSVGNADGLGSTRRNELVKSFGVLGVESGNVDVLDHPDLQDDITQTWNNSLVAEIVEEYIQRYHIASIITFDEHGISSHPNHISLFHGARLIPSKLPIWALHTTGVAAKYTGYLGVIFPPAIEKERVVYASSIEWYVKALAAMREHWTQLVWFRWLYVGWSRYMWINELKRVV